jgi:hypothetical protein
MPLSPRPSAGRRRTALRLEPLEDRAVPAVAIGTNISGPAGGLFAPPDTDGAVGPNRYVQFINGTFIVYDTSGARRPADKPDYQFWNDAGIPAAVTKPGLSDTRVIYDPLSGRWFATEITTARTGNRVLVGRSDTADPYGTWKAVSYVGNSGFADYPTLGVDFNAVYVGTNNFTSAVGRNKSVTISSIPKASLLQAKPTVAGRKAVEQANPGGNRLGYTLQGVTNFSPDQTAASKGSILAVDYHSFTDNSIDITALINLTPVNGAGAAGATLGTTTHLPVLPISTPGLARQPDGTAQVDGDDERLASMVYQVGDLIFATHGVSVDSAGNTAATWAGTTDAVRVEVIRKSTAQVVTEATYFNPNFDYTFPSLAVNAQGDMVIGFTRSAFTLGSGATNGNLGAYAVYAHIDMADPAAGITFGPELQLQAGLTDSYHLFSDMGDPRSTDRWGDFSATSVDPNNPTSFWTTQEYAIGYDPFWGADDWGTKISQVWVSPRVTAVATTAPAGAYAAGEDVPITVTFNDAVDVTGTPQLLLNAGAGAAATYVGGSGTKTLTFNYRVAAGQFALAPNYLDYVSAAALTGGTIEDHNGPQLAADLTLPAPGATGLGPRQIVVNGNMPAVTGVTSGTPNGAYGYNAPITIAIHFNRPVAVDTTGGPPTLALNTTPARSAVYSGGSGSTTLTFTYTVQLGDFAARLDSAGTSALVVPAGSGVTDQASGTPARLTLVVPGAAGSLGANSNLAVDAVPARPADVTAPTTPNGLCPAGTVIPLTVTFTKPVVVDTTGGALTLALDSGGTAVYAGGSGTFTVLPFTYTVGLGEQSADLDAAGSAALALNGATIQDEASDTPAPLDLPTAGAAGSLAVNKDIAVDTRGPSVRKYLVRYGSRWYDLTAGPRIDLPWKVTALRTVFDEPVMIGTPASLTGLTATRLTGLRTTTLTWTLAAPIVKGSFNTGLASAGTDAVRDAAGNLANPFAQAFNVLWGDVNGDHVVDALDEAGVRAHLAGPFQLGTVTFDPFADLSGDGLVSLIDVGTARVRKGATLP